MASGIMTKNLNHALRFSKSIKAGTVWVNTYQTYQATMPFGGYKMRGFGRDLGEYALSNYTNVKAVHISPQNSVFVALYGSFLIHAGLFPVCLSISRTKIR
jgi:aldehyde dehydrogenase (NAD+)